MLIRSLFLVAFIVILAETFVRGSMALGNATLHARALDAAQSQMVRAATTLQNGIAAQVQAGSAGANAIAVFPSPQPTCVANNADGCALVATTTVAAAPLASASATPTCSPSCTAYYQENDTVEEARVNAVVSTTIATTTGVTIAQRSALISFRTLNVAPYAALVGSLDGTQSALVPNGIGDDGGVAPGSSDGTLMYVEYRNILNPSESMPANVWQAHAYNAPPATLPWDP